MHMIPVTREQPFWAQLCRLAREAFPPEEYLPPETLLEMAQQEHFDFLALLEGERFVGFLVVQTGGGMAYLFFLAICADCRSHGYGGRALALLRQAYPGLRQVVDLEMTDSAAANASQRQARRDFYLRGGYRPTGLFLSYLGVDYEVLCGDADFDPAAFRALLAGLRIEGFAPRYFRLDSRGRRVEAF